MGARLLLAVALLASGSARATEFTYVRASDPARVVCGGASVDWVRPELDDSGWPLRDPLPPDAGAPDGGAGCSATLYLRWRFDVADELDRLATLTLRVRYAHGMAAYLNGEEIARRRLDPGAAPAALATEVHGPEAERIFVALRPGLLRPHGNVFAIEVHPRTPGHAPSAEVELDGADGVRIVRGPYLQRLSGSAVTVVLDTDLPSSAEVRFGSSEAYGAVVADATPARHHLLKLSGLKPGAVYHYRAVVQSSRAPALAQNGRIAELPVDLFDAGDVAFHTPPEEGRPLRFVVYGDVRSGHDVHAQLDQQIRAEDPDLAILTGDLVDRGSDEGDWERFFEIAGPLLRGLAIFPAIGNHEYARLGRGAATFLQLFRTPERGDDGAAYYSFDASGVHFVALDSNQYRSPRQLAWLDHDLAEAERRRARALFVYAHEPPVSSGMHGDNQVALHDYVPVMERHHVTWFFGGHDDHYERGRIGGLDYVVTGGGGAELRAPRCGVVGKRPCPPHVLAFANEHHYVLVEVLPSFVRLCAKRPDGSPLEACVERPLLRARSASRTE